MRDHISSPRHERDSDNPGERRHPHRPHDGERLERAFRRGMPGGPGGRGERPERPERPERGERGHRGGPRGQRGPGPRFTDAEPTPVSTEAITGWLTGRLPAGWFTGTPTIDVDRDEIWVVGTLADVPEGSTEGTAEATTELEEGRISRFREESRDQRMVIAREAEQRYERRVAWGATAGGTTQMFSTASVPVMTRLRQPERQVLDTLVDAGVARSRSDALAWCVRLVSRNTDEWLGKLREAMTEVERVREQGPTS